MPPDDPRSVPTGRTWRDLPPAPPTSARPVEPPPVVSAPAPSRGARALPWVAAGAVILFLGFIFGLITPSQLPTGDSLGEPDAESLSTLPEEIVPPVPPELQTPGTEEPPAQETEPLFRVTVVPEGFQQTQNVAQRSAGAVTQVTVLSGDPGDLVIEAQASESAFELPEGDPVSVRGADGVVEEPDTGGLRVTWLERGQILFRITAPDGYPLEDVVTLAESLEVP